MHFKLWVSLFLSFYARLLWADEVAHVVFLAGEAKVAGRTVQVGDKVAEGELLTTSKDGYLYLQTIDKGFFILRPGSTGQIVRYKIDSENPVNTRIKIELQNGVARHISGDAVKNARQNFRFNTPVAAIGVRGTDFTVFANQETTRISVLSGGVVVSPFSSACTTSSFGPCAGSSSKELFANMPSQVLQVKRNQMPMLLQGTDQAPDAANPARPDEPASPGKTISGKSMAGSSTTATASLSNLDPLKVNLISQLSSQLSTQVQVVNVIQPDLPSQLIWGRWQAVLDHSLEVDVAALQATHQLIATNSYYALMRRTDSNWQAPVANTLGFSLKQAQAFIQDTALNKVTPAQLENGQLKIDFGKASFFTKFDLIGLNERFLLQNTGEVTPDGKLYGGYQFLRPNNMDVRGALANNNSAAAYLFQARLEDGRIASGVTGWGK